MNRFAIMSVLAAFTIGVLTTTVVGLAMEARQVPAPVSSPSPSPSLTREDWLADPYVRCIEAMGNAELPAELCAPMDDPR